MKDVSQVNPREILGQILSPPCTKYGRDLYPIDERRSLCVFGDYPCTNFIVQNSRPLLGNGVLRAAMTTYVLDQLLYDCSHNFVAAKEDMYLYLKEEDALKIQSLFPNLHHRAIVVRNTDPYPFVFKVGSDGSTGLIEPQSGDILDKATRDSFPEVFKLTKTALVLLSGYAKRKDILITNITTRVGIEQEKSKRYPALIGEFSFDTMAPRLERSESASNAELFKQFTGISIDEWMKGEPFPNPLE